MKRIVDVRGVEADNDDDDDDDGSDDIGDVNGSDGVARSTLSSSRRFALQ